MKTTKKVQQRIEELEAEVKALREELGVCENNRYRYGDIVFYAPGRHDRWALNQFNIGGVEYYHSEIIDEMSWGGFLDEETALKHARQRDAVAKMMKMKGARPFVKGVDNYFIGYDHYHENVVLEYQNSFEQPNTVYFDTHVNALYAYHDKQLMSDLFMREVE